MITSTLWPPAGRGGGELAGLLLVGALLVGGLLVGGWDELGGTELLAGLLLVGAVLVGLLLVGGSLLGGSLVGGSVELADELGTGAGPVVTCSSGGWSVFRLAQDHRMLLWVAAMKVWTSEPSIEEVTSAVEYEPPWTAVNCPAAGM